MSAVFIFCPALKRPCGAGLRPRSQRRSSESKLVELAAVRSKPRAVAEQRSTSTSDVTQPMPPQKWMSLISGRRATSTDRLGR